MLLLLACAWPVRALDTVATTYQNVVVMVDASFDHSQGEIGAGIVIDETPVRTVIVTALHVVQKRDTGEMASKVDIEFRTLRGETFSGKLNEHYVDFDLDLAVIFIDRTAGANMPTVLPADRAILAGGAVASRKATPVQIVGAMRGKRWATGVRTDKVVAVENNELQIESADAAAGGSGGAIFDSLGRLVGMPVHMQHGVLFALPMTTIATRLDDWGIPMALSTAAIGSGSGDLLAAYQGRVSFAVTYSPDPKMGDLSVNPTPPFGNSVQAVMTPDLRALQPTIDVTYEFLNRKQALSLSPPHYVARVTEWPASIDAQYWISFRDGRKFGPMQTKLDFESSVTATAHRLGAKASENLTNGMKQLDLNRMMAERTRQTNAAQLAAFNAQQQQNRQQILQANDERNLKDAEKNFSNASIQCWRPDGGKGDWTCSGLGFSAYFEHVVHSLRIGPASGNLADALPPSAMSLETRVFGEAITQAIVRMLGANRNARGVYIRIELTSGLVLGPKPLCIRKDTNCVPSTNTDTAN
ncbi:S1 family peptidase [Paraburkholderia sp. CI3]|uniref:S1 family peptidase n=1 Tax=Paraburkholderia sp. CI3 TaxID=2991060 RepID=UPI003D242D54